MDFFNWVGKGKTVIPEASSEDAASNRTITEVVPEISDPVDKSLESSSDGQITDRVEESYDMTATIEEFRVYMTYRVPSAMVFGGIAGVSVGYYVGDLMALYGYTYAFGLGFSSTFFYGGVYGLKKLRQTDDLFNYGISGAANAGLAGFAFGGRKTGLKFTAAGFLGGVLAKYGGEYVYTTFRNNWIGHRRFTIEHSRPRYLQSKPKMRRPLKGEDFSPRTTYTLTLFPPSEKNTDLTDMSKEPTRPSKPKE